MGDAGDHEARHPPHLPSRYPAETLTPGTAPQQQPPWRWDSCVEAVFECPS